MFVNGYAVSSTIFFEQFKGVWVASRVSRNSRVDWVLRNDWDVELLTPRRTDSWPNSSFS